jgi:protein-tyrosine phosphatase
VPEIFWVDANIPGRVGVAMRPRGGNYLADDMPLFKAAGVDVLVSALGEREVRENWLSDCGSHASAAGIEFVHFPIPNLLTPPYETAMPVIGSLAERVARGQGLATHCFAGIGRSTTIAASILVVLGLDPEDAWERIRAVRGVQLPDTKAQYEWVLGIPGWLQPTV